MKKCHFPFFLLLLTLIACHKEDIFDPKNYEGEYPRNMDGSQIQTYTPQIKGGEVSIKYNGHTWNHTPFLTLYGMERNLIDNNVNQKMLNLSVYAATTDFEMDNCVKEFIVFQLPFELGKKNVTKDYLNKPFKIISYYTLDCDAGKDEFGIDFSKSSWLDVKSFDETTRQLQFEFDINFIITKRQSDFGPIYPKYVNFKGSCTTTVKK